MKKVINIWLCVLLIFSSAEANSQGILGGELFITESSGEGGRTHYTLGLELYAPCSNNQDSLSVRALFPSSIKIAIYSNATGDAFYINEGSNIRLWETKTISDGRFPPCVVNAGIDCYNRAIYSFPVILPLNDYGYTVVYEACCRASGIKNIIDAQGYTITTKLVSRDSRVASFGTELKAHNTNQVLCANAPFSMSIFEKQIFPIAGARLSYQLLPAAGSNVTADKQTAVSKGEPYPRLLYDTANGYTGFFPLGKNVTIDTATGIISGIAPPPGDYLVNVLVTHYWEGLTPNMQRQFIQRVRSCRFDGALLEPVRTVCDSFTVPFKNLSAYSDIKAYQWQFIQNNTVIGSSTLTAPNFLFPDTGRYTIRLVVTNSTGCTDTAIQQLNLYPTLKAGFTIQGNCSRFPYMFTDTSTTTLGTITRKWDLGDETTIADTSLAKSVSYQYTTQSKKDIRLTVTNTLGCSAVISKTLDVSDKPSLLLSTHDTLMCSIDTLALRADGEGVISWSPAYNIIGAQTATPFVFPKRTTSYIATINYSGCINSDTVTVNVLDYITVNAGPDISLCSGDSIKINTNSQALSYHWSPAIGLNSDTAKSPVISPILNMEYFVTANLGNCQAKDTLLINIFPYPLVNAGDDTLSCSGARTILQGNTNATDYFWTPSVSLFNTGSLNPAAIPIATTKYVLTGYNKQGCTKPVSDTMLVTVIPNKITVDAGRDTSVVVGQPLQLHATATDSINYLWTPSSGLSDPTILNPVAILNGIYDSIKYTITATSGVCKTQDDVVIKIFKGKPDIYVPSAFTPNGDGRNDVLHPVPVGIKTFLSFDIFQRWGGQLFHTTDFYKGWDGKVNGKDQSNGTYVFIARGIDYLGNYIERTGTVTIIR